MSSSSDDTIILFLSLSSSPSTPRAKIEFSKSKTTVTELRSLVSDTTKIPLATLKLIYRGRLIQKPVSGEDSIVCESYNLENECVIHCIGKPDISASTSASSTATSSTASAPSNTVAGPTVTTTPNTDTPSPPLPAENSLTAGLSLLKSSASSTEVLKTALTTLIKVITNITTNPMEEKYRSIKSTNAAFQRRLGGVTGGPECLKALGFELVGEEFKIVPTAEAWENLVQSKTVLERELTSITSSSTVPPFQQPAAPSSFGMPPLPTGGFGGSNPGLGGGFGSQQQALMDQMLSNPQMMQNMLRSNPMLSQYLTPQQQELLNNPAMLEQMRQFTQNNPNLVRDMQQMMQHGGAGGNMADMQRNVQDMMMRMRNSGFGAGMTAPPTQPSPPPNTNTQQAASNASTQQQQQQQSSSNNQGDEGMTEEEMIAEAIARSLRES